MKNEYMAKTFNMLPAAAFLAWAGICTANGTFTDPNRVPDTSHVRYDETAGTATIPILRVPLFGESTVDSVLTYGCDGTTKVRTEVFVSGAPAGVERSEDAAICQDYRVDHNDIGQLLRL